MVIVGEIIICGRSVTGITDASIVDGADFLACPADIRYDNCLAGAPSYMMTSSGFRYPIATLHGADAVAHDSHADEIPYQSIAAPF